jgi:hypothetical protein
LKSPARHMRVHLCDIERQHRGRRAAARFHKRNQRRKSATGICGLATAIQGSPSGR